MKTHHKKVDFYGSITPIHRVDVGLSRVMGPYCAMHNHAYSLTEYPMNISQCTSIYTTTHSLFLSPPPPAHYNGYFSGEPGLAPVFLQLRMMEVVLTAGAIRCAKWGNPTNAQHFTCWMPFLPPNQVSTHWMETHCKLNLKNSLVHKKTIQVLGVKSDWR